MTWRSISPSPVLVDELDLLITKNEKVLYNLFEWPARKGSRLIVIGIANTMDLPERLSSRIGSRMGTLRPARLPFWPCVTLFKDHVG